MKYIFSNSKTLNEALSLIRDSIERYGIKNLATEVVGVKEAENRITAKAVFARYSSPFYHSAAMDGYALRFRDTLSASERQPLQLKIGSDALYVDTGDPMPEGFDSVVMVEDVNIVQDNLEIYKPATPYQHVRVIGEDIVATELIVPENHKLRAIDRAAIAASGIQEVEVKAIPKASIIPTGTEIIDLKEVRNRPPIPPEIIEYNSIFLKGMLQEAGAAVSVRDILRDDLKELKSVISNEALKSDIIVIIAGSGKGAEDYTAQAIEELGELIIHGVSIKPGKPFIFGIVGNKPVIGIPGYPVSAYICARLFVIPLLEILTGVSESQEETVKAVLSRQLSSQLGVDEFVRVKVGAIGDRIVATPVGRGAGLIMSLVRADGIIRIPAESEGYSAGTEVSISPVRSLNNIQDTIVCIGSHDNTLDILGNYIRKRFPTFYLSSAHVGSMGGLLALKRGEAHIAGIHLLDEKTGQYNSSFIQKLLPERKIVLVNLLYRQQGLLVLRGNPKGIQGFEDLTRDDVMYINRQSGSGTRLLLDKHLKELHIKPSSIRGYDREEYTHMSVASAVLTGLADTGLGVYSSAKALGLDFIPVAMERYDIAIPQEFMDKDNIKAMLSVIRDDLEFRSTVVSLGGYDIEDMGKIVN